jgi:hypothetical protein
MGTSSIELKGFYRSCCFNGNGRQEYEAKTMSKVHCTRSLGILVKCIGENMMGVEMHGAVQVEALHSSSTYMYICMNMRIDSGTYLSDRRW